MPTGLVARQPRLEGKQIPGDPQRLLLDTSAGFAGRLERRTIRDVIADKLGAMIASGFLSVGDELPSERELASALSVSRETVRGAIQALAARGILDVVQGMRTRVSSVDFSSMAVGITNHRNVNGYGVHDVHAARLLIELHVVGEAADRMSDAALERLERSIEVQEDCLEDPVRFLICDREFHVTIYRECGNPLLADIVTDLYTYLMDDRRRSIAQPGAIGQSLGDHKAVLAALQVRGREAAIAAFAVHEDRIYTSTKRLLAQDGAAATRASGAVPAAT